MTLLASGVVLAFVLLASSVAVTSGAEQRASARDSIEREEETRAAEAERQAEAERARAKQQEVFSSVDLIGKAAFVYDINTDTVLFEKNGDTALPLASITKVMTAITAQDILPRSSTITIDALALATEGDSGLSLGEVWSFEELADLMLIVSSNDASTAIANAAGNILSEKQGLGLAHGEAGYLFIDKMNKKAEKIGMEKASFANATGLDLENETKPSAVASPRDVAKLLTYALLEYPDILNHSRFGSYSVVALNGRNFQVENTNNIADSIPGLLASKTGYTLQAGGNLAVVVDIGFMRPVVLVVLGSTYDGRFDDIETLFTITKQYFNEL